MAGEPRSLEWTITQARIVALLSLEGGAIVEHGDYEVSEGRRPTLGFSDEGKTEQAGFDYYCGFGVIGAAPPDASEATEAFVVIDGTGPHGRIEIRGNGFFGYDDQGNPEGWFDEPPMMLLDEYPAPPATDDQQDDYDSDRVINAQPKLSEEYQRALRGRVPHAADTCRSD
ncbi:hypothetical protein [Sphingomonas sp. RS2018]